MGRIIMFEIPKESSAGRGVRPKLFIRISGADLKQFRRNDLNFPFLWSELSCKSFGSSLSCGLIMKFSFPIDLLGKGIGPGFYEYFRKKGARLPLALGWGIGWKLGYGKNVENGISRCMVPCHEPRQAGGFPRAGGMGDLFKDDIARGGFVADWKMFSDGGI